MTFSTMILSITLKNATISITTLGTVMQSAVLLFVFNAECRKLGHFADCHHAVCRHDECRGALTVQSFVIALLIHRYLKVSAYHQYNTIIELKADLDL
jgi:hypothetical protein